MTGSATVDDRPNVLMITADDAAVGDLEYMPLTRRLVADRGVTFTNAIAPDPICVPARASLLTGQYTHNHKAYTINGEGGGYQAFDNRKTLPIWLQAAGYDTLFVGKYLNGYGDDGRPTREPGWNEWRATMGGSTYTFTRTVLNVNGRARLHTQYSTDLLSDQTVQVLGRPRRRTKPWYMWVNYVAPHQGGVPESDDPQMTNPSRPADWVGTTTVAPEHRDRFRHLDLPRTPDLFHGDGDGVRTAGPSFSPGRRAAAREGYQQRLEALQSVDEAVARAVRKLRSTGQLGNTVIIFASDNGFLTGQHNIFGKLWQFNDSLRIPMVMAGPGIPRGRTVRTAVTNPDIATTIAALARAKPQREQDGVNVLPYLDKGYRERVVPIEAYPVHGGTTPLYTGVRVGEWTYIRTRNGREELFNRDVDPHELRSLAGRKKYADDLLRLRALNVTYKDCVGDTCPKDFVKIPTRPR